MERNGIKIGFLGYCDIISINKNCTEMRMLFNSGPAVYRDDIATRDVHNLKEVVQIFQLLISCAYTENFWLSVIPGLNSY